MTDLAVGATLNDRYRLEDEIGRGGMGTVYRAHDTTLNRDVAVKLLSNSGLGTEGRDRLLNEAQAIAQLSHPNIVSVFDAGEQDDTPYIVMEVIEGASLHDRPPNDLAAIARVAAQVCAALAHAHSHGVVHRDLKPENVLIAEDGAAKLMDFGIARSVASRMTTEGQIVGTVFYLAPEIALGKEFDGRADLYSLGVMLYELTTGELPFSGGDPLAVISQHIHASVVPPRAKNEQVPPRLDDLILSLMEKSPDNRPASAAEAQKMLERSDLLDPEAEGVKEIAVVRRIARGRFVGREQELIDATSLWNKALAGDGQLLLVSGEPGIGKTRLIRELSTQVEVTGGRSLIGECESEGGAPYAPFAQIIRKTLRQGAQNGFELPDFVLSDLLELTPELKPYYPDVPPNPKLDPEAEQQRLFENVVAFCKALSENAPLMLVIDDAHWADSSTLSLLRYLAGRTQNQRTLLAATYREVEIDEARPFHEALLELNRKRLGTRLKLKRFDEQQTRDLLAAVFEEEITLDFLGGIFEETEGNPFFIEEVCKALVESGQVYHDENGWGRVSMEEIQIPQSVRVAIQSRVSKFPEEYQDALNLAAILGREFDFDTLAAASELDEDTLIEALEMAEGAQLIEEVSGEGGATFSFVHALIPSTLAEGVRTLRRRRLHKRAAEAIEATRPDDYEELAHHYEEAGDEDQARAYYIRAGERAAAAFANAEAEEHFQAALELQPSEVERVEVLSQLAEVINRLSRPDQAISYWQEAVDLYGQLGNRERVALCYSRMARAAWFAGDQARTLAFCEEGMAMMDGAPDSPEYAGMIHEAARAYHFASYSEETADRLCRQALEMARHVSATRVEADALATFGILSTISSDEAVAALEQAVELAKREGHLKEESRARNNLGVILAIDRAEIRAAEHQYLEGAALQRRMGDLTGELFGLCNAADEMLIRGDLAGATKIVDLATGLVEQIGDAGGTGAEYRFLLALFDWVAGRLESAAARYEPLLEEALSGGEDFTIAVFGADYGYALFDLGRMDEAEAFLQQAVAATNRANYAQGPAHAALVLTLAKRGALDQAREVLGNVRSYLAEHPKRWPQFHIDIAGAALAAAEQHWDDAFRAFEQVVADLEGAGIRPYQALALRRWADAHLSRGEPGDVDRARELLEQALAIYQDMGAEGWVERVEARLGELKD
jgi:predicted ATPase